MLSIFVINKRLILQLTDNMINANGGSFTKPKVTWKK